MVESLLLESSSVMRSRAVPYSILRVASLSSTLCCASLLPFRILPQTGRIAWSYGRGACLYAVPPPSPSIRERSRMAASLDWAVDPAYPGYLDSGDPHASAVLRAGAAWRTVITRICQSAIVLAASLGCSSGNYPALRRLPYPQRPSPRCAPSLVGLVCILRRLRGSAALDRDNGKSAPRGSLVAWISTLHLI